MDKFLLFLIINGEEIPFYYALKNNLIKHIPDRHNSFLYDSSVDLIKIFITQRGFNCRPLRKTFFVQLVSNKPLIKINSFSGTMNGFFDAEGKLLTREEGAGLLKNEVTLKYLQTEPKLSLEALKAIVKIDRSNLRKGLRHIRIGGKV